MGSVLGPIMRIFLSYASEDRSQAALVVESLKARGHKVFFDRNDLPGGESYEDQIEKAIGKADLMIFLISPDSLSDGKFTRTELKFAREKWPSAKSRVLPVMLKSVPIDDVPAYLRAVSILEPEGNIPAETAAAAHALSKRWPRRVRAVLVPIVVIGAVAAAAWYIRPASLDVTVSSSKLPFERALFDTPAVDNIVYKIENGGTVGAELLDVVLETAPTDALTMARPGRSPETDGPEMIAPGGDYTGHFLINSDVNDALSYRICGLFSSGAPQCGAWSDWETPLIAAYLYGDAFRIPPALGRSDGPLVWTGENYLVADGSNLFLLTESGEIAEVNSFDAPITALHLFGDAVFAAIGGVAPSVMMLNRTNFDVRGTLNISLPESATGTFGEPLSLDVIELADDGTHLWFRTSDANGAAALGYIDLTTGETTLPPYFDDISFDVRGFRLKSGDGSIWSGQSDTTPTSLYRFATDAYDDISGHDYELASCVTDVLPRAGGLVVPDCDGRATPANWVNGRLSGGADIDFAYGYKTGVEIWSDLRLAMDASGRLIGLVETVSSEGLGGDGSSSVTVSRLGWERGSAMIFDADGAELLDFAVGKTTILLRLRSPEQQVQLVAIPLEDVD